MIRRGRASLVVASGMLIGCGGADRPPSGGETADPPPVVEAELFAPGVISSELPEFATSFTPSGDTVFFNRTPPDRSRLDLFFAIRTGEGWSEPEPFPPLAGSTAIDPFVSTDGLWLYFSSDRGRAGRLDGVFNLWRLDLRAPRAIPEALPAPINTDSSEVFNAVSADGRMVFSSRRDGERRVYEVDLEAPGSPEPVLLALGDSAAASNPTISPDGRLLVFARSDGDEPPDLFLACRGTEGWEPPIRLPPPINSEFADFAPGFGGGDLYFTSERPGVVPETAAGERPPGDIYRTAIGPVRALCSGEDGWGGAVAGELGETSAAGAAQDG